MLIVVPSRSRNAYSVRNVVSPGSGSQVHSRQRSARPGSSPACIELEAAFREAWADPAFRAELDELLATYAGRPSPLTECHRLSEQLGLRLLLKREDLNHTGSHKINNVLGQALLTKRMGKQRLVAETGAGQHGVATATAAALMGFECTVYMGEVDMERQKLNVFRMRLLGAEVKPALSGSRTLKDAVNEAMRDWVATVETSHYCLGSVMGPHPYPWLVRELHRVIVAQADCECAPAPSPAQAQHMEDLIDEADAESFPASDPPAVTPRRAPVRIPRKD